MGPRAPSKSRNSKLTTYGITRASYGVRQLAAAFPAGSSLRRRDASKLAQSKAGASSRTPQRRDFDGALTWDRMTWVLSIRAKTLPANLLVFNCLIRPPPENGGWRSAPICGPPRPFNAGRGVICGAPQALECVSLLPLSSRELARGGFGLEPSSPPANPLVDSSDQPASWLAIKRLQAPTRQRA